MKVLKQLESEKTWEENTDLFEGDFDFVPEENDDGTVSYVVRKVNKVNNNYLNLNKFIYVHNVQVYCNMLTNLDFLVSWFPITKLIFYI